MSTLHVDHDQLAAYAERRLTPTEYQRVEHHLADCAECRRDAVAVTLVLRSDRRRRVLRVAAPLAAAAALLFVLLPPKPGPEETPRFRPGSPREAATVIPVWSPTTAATPGSDRRLIWGSAGPGTLYRLTVTDSSGGVVWTHQLVDTIAAIPDSASIRAGARYHWYVDALLVNGERATTGLRDRRLAP
ncbi:MAG: zf-HC2 domain-containing protein [Gemmatimonadetes bacterium]|nr:zf-HC2 domain-containing protein [Gemmatimonadota bacterium]